MRSVRPLRVLRNALVCALAVGAVWACYGPTELVVSVSTNVDCAAVQTNGLSIRTAASEGQLLDAPAATESNACELGPRGADLGTLVLVPSGVADDVVLQVVLGVDRPTSECQPPSRIEGCIVARRRVGYVHHRSLRVPIVLNRACLGVQCGEGETCERGACVSAAVQTCAGGDCELEADGSAPLPLTDGAPLDDVAPPTDTPVEAGLNPHDASTDASCCPARPPPLPAVRRVHEDR